jgi:hypothetical protein
MVALRRETIPFEHGEKTSLPEEYQNFDETHSGRNEKLAVFLGLFSLGLGLWELAAPRSVGNTTGTRGSAVTKLKKGDRIVVPFDIACGECWFCQRQLYSCCDETNPNAAVAAQVMGYAPAGLYGDSHLTGGYAGGQAECLRVVRTEANVIKIPDGMPDEKVVFLSDIFPTGYMAAEQA